MAKTAAQRKREQRQRERESTEKDRLDVIVAAQSVKFLKAYSEYRGITLTDVVEEAIADFWRTMPHEKQQEMWAQDRARNEEKRVRQLGDTRTIPLFGDLDDAASA